MTPEDAVRQVLAEYYAAFSTLDVEAVLPFFHEPALLLGPQGAIAAASRSEVAAVFGPAMEALRNRGYGRSELDLHDLKLLGTHAALATGVAVRFKSDGQELERAGVTYLLHYSGTEWRFAAFVLHNLVS